jgi:hypothetical protein
MFLPMSTLVDLPFRLPGSRWKSELQGVYGPISSIAGRRAPQNHAFFKIMAGTTNEYFRKWCFENKKWCIPFNVIMVEVTFGGTNAPICHGAGLSSSTLSDLVAEVTYIDARGEEQVVNDPQELRAASGCFGLLGIVTSITLQLDGMGVAELAPTKLPTVLAIPPPKGYPIPEEIVKQMKKDKIDDQKLERARVDFIKRCEEDYYVEWFWFPYQTHCWVNTWKSTQMGSFSLAVSDDGPLPERLVTPQDTNIQTYPDNNIITGAQAQAASVLPLRGL